MGPEIKHAAEKRPRKQRTTPNQHRTILRRPGLASETPIQASIEPRAKCFRRSRRLPPSAAPPLKLLNRSEPAAAQSSCRQRIFAPSFTAVEPDAARRALPPRIAIAAQLSKKAWKRRRRLPDQTRWALPPVLAPPRSSAVFRKQFSPPHVPRAQRRPACGQRLRRRSCVTAGGVEIVGATGAARPDASAQEIFTSAGAVAKPPAAILPGPNPRKRRLWLSRCDKRRRRRGNRGGGGATVAGSAKPAQPRLASRSADS